MTFELLPAIDLRAGRVVRLRQGDFDQETVFGDDPAATAERLVAAGASWIHVVDLDGARAGAPRQTECVARIVERVGERARCQVAGGLRTAEAVAAALAGGAARVVVGTAALEDPALAGELVRRHGPDRIVVALDVRDGLALGQAWRAGATGRPVEELLETLGQSGVERFAVTAIERDGLLGGPDLELLARLVGLGRGAIIASGGIGSLADLQAVRRLGCSGAIIGRALYEGRLDLAEAVRAVSD
ncbi:MAG: HisA/HisF-related TIM barrel protein [Chloroflexota bacterium]